MRLLGMILFAFVMGTQSFAQQAELLERVYSGSSKKTNPQEARKDIQDQAFEKVSEEVIKELIGEDRYSKNKNLINNKIIRNSARYIPFVKPGPLTAQGEESKMSVSLKVSMKDIKLLLQNNSLLSDNDTLPVVLPMIAWVDRVQGRSHRWWQSVDKDQGYLVSESKIFETALRGAFERNNFFLVKPQEASLGTQVPVAFHNEKLNPESSQFFASLFNAPVLIDGQVLLQKADKGNGYRIEIKMTAIKVSNGRAIADVSRRFETSGGTFETVVDKKLREVADAAASDLAIQVFEAWQRGSVSSNILKITIQGRSSLKELESFKESVRAQMSQVKNIRERLITSEIVSFEVDTNSTPEELVSKFEGLNLGKKLVRVTMNSDEIVLKWNQ